MSGKDEKPDRGAESELGLMWQVEGTLGGEKHEAKKSYSKGDRSSLPYS